MKKSLGKSLVVSAITLLIGVTTNAASAGEGNVFTKFMRWTGYGIGDGYHTCPCPKPIRPWQRLNCNSGGCGPIIGSPCEYGCAQRTQPNGPHQQFAKRSVDRIQLGRIGMAQAANVTRRSPTNVTRQNTELARRFSLPNPSSSYSRPQSPNAVSTRPVESAWAPREARSPGN